MLVQIVTENGQKKVIPLTADAGSGVALGMIVPFFVKRERSGYLFCDGSRFDTTKYPLLYAELGTDILPDCREVGLTGAEKNTTYIFDSTETDPRTGQAGTQNHDVFTQGEFKDDQLQSHSHVFNANSYDFSGSANATSGSDVRGVVISSSQNPYSLTVTNARKGDVTRGKSLAVYWYIKATSGLSENAQDNVVAQLNEERSYSTSEVNTGKKWIDGKPIYRIVTTATKNQQVDTTAYKDTGAPLPSNVDKYILIRSTQNTANAFYYSTTNTTLYIAAVSTMNALSGTNYILEYTKTT